MEKLLKKYSVIQSKIDELQKQQDALKEEIGYEMNRMKLDTYRFDKGTFYFTYRKSWEYSERITKMAEAVKCAKKNEEEDGTATYKESKSLSFRNITTE
jgi:hypothetical protein